MQTRANNVISEKKIIKRGVPQGSVLGLLLYLLYINNVQNGEIKKNVQGFCWRYNYYIQWKYKRTKTKANAGFNFFDIWLRMNVLTLYTGKTKYIIFKQKKSRIHN